MYSGVNEESGLAERRTHAGVLLTFSLLSTNLLLSPELSF